MKTTKIFQIALVAGMVSLATAASAQTLVPGTPAATSDVAATQVDYVTVGATMPYRTDASQADLQAWQTALTAAGLTPTVTSTTKWYTGTTEIAGTDGKSEVSLQWTTAGEYTLKVANSISVDGVTSCAAAESTKKVYVLPVPTASITSTSQVLPCNTTSFDVKYKVAGIGQKQLKYTVTKKPYAAAASTDPQATVNVGTGVTTVGEFADNVTFATATANYDVAAAAEQTFSVSGLESGYIYTLTFNEVSDQISRKSSVTSSLSSVAVTLAVVPTPVSTKINHIQNIE